MANSPTGIQVTAKYFPIAFLIQFFWKPVLTIDGVESKGAWGEQFVPLAPGSHTVDIHWKYLFIIKANPATIQVTVPEGGSVNLLYKARWMVFLPAKLDVVP